MDLWPLVSPLKAPACCRAQKSFEDLQKVLKRLRASLDDASKDKMFVYMVSGVLCGLVVPAEVEEAVRLGELESVSLSRTCDKAAFKIRQTKPLLNEYTYKNTR
jgi:hypothetical protein